MNKTNIIMQGLIAAMIVSPCALAQSNALTFGTGFNYSSGDYGTSTTTRITSIPFTAKYETGPWSLKATVPYVRIEGDTAVVPGVGRVGNSNPRNRGVTAALAGTSSSTESGLGDVVIAATRNMYYDSTAKFGFDVTGKMKLGTADRDKGLGTGENDYGLHIEPYKTFGSTTVFGSLGYTHLGSSQFIQLDNVISASIGASHKLNAESAFGGSFDMRERSSPSGFPQREATAFYSRNISNALKAQFYVLKGFADGSPDWGAGATLTMAIN